MGILDAPPIPPGTVGQRLRRAADAAYGASHLDRGVMAAPPTLTQASTSAALDSTLTTSVRPVTDSAQASFAFRGGVPTVFSTSFYRMPSYTVTSGGNISSTRGASAQAVEFFTDAPKVIVNVVGDTASARGFMVEVDGQPIQAAGQPYFSITSEYFMLDFTSIGGRKPRRIRYEFDQSVGAFGGVWASSADSFWPPETGIRVALVGDSTSIQTGASLPNGGWGQSLGKMLGWGDIWNIGIGGCGWITTAAGGNTFGSSARQSDVQACNPDMLVTYVSQNDSSQTTSAVTAAMLAGLQAYRALLPGVPFLVGGVNPNSSNVGGTFVALENAGKAAVDAFNDGLTFWCPITTATTTNRSKPWLFGSGYTGATNGSGNSDVLLNDSAHYSQLGHNYWAYRWRDWFRSQVLTSSSLR